MIKKMIGVSLGAVSLASLTSVSAEEVDSQIAEVDTLESLTHIAAKAQELGLSVNEETKEVYVDSESEVKDKEARDLVFAKQDLKEAIKKLAVYEADNKKLEGSLKDNQEAIDKIIAANKAKLEAYDKEVARVNAENAKKEEAYKKELEAVNRENLENQQKAEVEILETASKRQEVLAQYQEDLARVNAENAARISAVRKENEALEADYQERLGAYNRELFEITKRNQEKEASYKKALAENVGEENVVSEERYAEEIEKHKGALATLRDFVTKDYEKAKIDMERFAQVFDYEFVNRFRNKSYVQENSKNQQNLEIKTSSNKVQFVKPVDTEDELVETGGDGRDTKEHYLLMNPDRPGAEITETPVYAKFKGIDYTIAKVPRGESITVSYSRKDGQPYELEDLQKLQTIGLVAKPIYDSKNHFDENDLGKIYRIDVTYKNEDSLFGDDPVNVMIFNDLKYIFKTGYSEMVSPYGNAPTRSGASSGEKNLDFHLRFEQTFYDQQNQQLIPVLADLEYKKVDENGLPQLVTEHKGYIKVNSAMNQEDGNLVTEEYVFKKDESGLFQARKVSYVKDLETDWRDKYLWTNIRRGFKNGSVIDIEKTYYKPYVDLATAVTRSRNVALTTSNDLPVASHFPSDLVLDNRLPFNFKKAATKPVYEEAPAKPVRPTYKEAALLPEPEKPNLENFKEPAPVAKKKVEAPVYEKLPEKPLLEKLPEKGNGKPMAQKPELDLTKKVYVLKKKGAASSFVVKTLNPKVGSSSSLVVRSKNTVIK